MTRGSRYTLAAFGIFFLLTAIFMPSTRASLDTGTRTTRAQDKGETLTYGTAQTIGQGTTVSVADLMALEKKSPPPKVAGERFTKDEYEFFMERRGELKQNPDSPLTPSWPPSAIEKGKPVDKVGVVSPNAPQTPGTSFLGVVSSEAGGFVPPDSHGTVGPTQVIVTANVFVRSFNKTTGVADGALALSLSTFFSPVSGGAGLSDPRIKFDPISRRWFISIITTSSSNRILFAVSSGPTITGTSSFTFFSFAATDGGGAESQAPFADYDTLGVDATGVYFGLNMFNTAGTAFLGSTVFVINKANLLATTPTLTVTAFRQLNNGSGAGASTPYVADNPDPAATEAYLVGVDNASLGLLVVRRITGAGTPTPAISGNFNVTVPATAAPINVTVQGRSQAALDSLDDRLFEAKVRNGSLWTAHNIGVNSTGVATTPDRTGSRWYEIGNLSTTPTLVQSGTLFSSAATNPDFFWIPSIGITGQGHAALACSAAGTARFPEIVSAGRLSGDAAGTLQAPATIQTSANSYTITANRWGDYSHVATDPNDDMTMWTFQEYAPSTSTWGVRAIQLRAPAPAAVTSISPTSATQGQTLNITVNGTSSGGTGFYNPPAIFPNRLAADFGPNVTVNSVTFNSPTQAVFNVTVQGGATTGTRNVTVTNPDGQSSTGSNLFTVNAGCATAITLSPSSLPTGITGIAYSQTITATGGTSPYSFSLASGTLPTGLTLSSGGLLSGIPSAAGTFNFTVLATDNSGFSCTGSQSYSVTIGSPSLTRGAVTVTTGNNLLEPNECNSLTVALSNGGTADATGVSATLSTSTPGVTVTAGTSAYPNILAGGSAQTNTTAFQVSTDNTVVCGSTINFTLNVTYVGGSASFNFTQLVGQAAGTNYGFTSTTGATISSGGTLITGSADDDFVSTFAVPFAFSVYGTNVASGQNIRLSTNGQVRIETAGSTTSTLTNAALPSNAAGLPTAAPVLFPYWDDLDMRTTITTGGGIYSEVTGTAPNRTLKLEWRARHFVASQTLGAPDTNFAVFFHEGSNQFEYVYALTGAGANAGGVSATVGIQAASTGTTFTQFSFNTASLSAGQQLAAAIPAGICNPGTGGCSTGATCGTPANINSLVSFTGSGSLQAPTCGAQGYSNDYVLNGTITNVSSQTLCSLSLQLLELSEAGGVPPSVPFRLISADGASCTTGGLPGAVQTISSPATLAPGQSANVTIRIAMPSARRFRITFNVFGGIFSGGSSSAIPAGKSMMAKAFEMNVEPVQAAKTQTFASDRNRSGLRRK